MSQYNANANGSPTRQLQNVRAEVGTIIDFVIQEDRQGRLSENQTLPSYEQLIRRNQTSSSASSSTRPSAQPVNCPECGKLLSCRGNLTRHMKSSHWGRRVRCPVPNCGLDFGQRHDLRRHMRRKHGVTKPS